MQPLVFVFMFALALVGGLARADGVESLHAHPFTARDLAMMDRLSDPQLSPDGRYALYTVRATDYAANKGVTSVYLLDLDGHAAPIKQADAASTPRWAPDGAAFYYLAPKNGVMQLWRRSLGSGAEVGQADPATVVTHAPLDIHTYKVSPNGKKALLVFGVFSDCADLACTRARLNAREAAPASGLVYDRLFVRHWDAWEDGRRSQLFIVNLNRPTAQPLLLTGGIDGDVPSKPFGDDGEFSFSPDGKTVYFDVRIAGPNEPWSTNFDIYSVPADGSAPPRNLTGANRAWDGFPVPAPDGRTLYYLAMKAPGAEADRFAVMAMDLATGQKREIAPAWDRSAGTLKISGDGKTLYATADDRGQHPLFAMDAATGEVSTVVTGGSVDGYGLAKARVLIARDDLMHPVDLYVADRQGEGLRQVTHANAQRLQNTQMGEPELFTFSGWNGEPVQGYVVKPVGYEPGKKYPVAFIIHGGPQGAMNNEWNYRWNPQTYAGQGFAVVTINFHGSTGYGQAFTDSISGDWGGKPLADLQLGWKAALEKYSFLDGTRACALGASYGGYMIYWMAGVWNQPWKCLVAHDGVFDTRAMYYGTDELWFEEHENGGAAFDYPSNYEKFNPVNHVKDWRVPMLVIHSAKDFRIPESQGLGAFTALQRRGIPSRLLYFPDENHWVLKPQNSVQWHETVNAWLKQWTSP